MAARQIVPTKTVASGGPLWQYPVERYPMIGRILAALCLLLAAFEMPAAEAQQRKAALVIGNGAYRHAPQLANPATDARAVADALRDLGFEVTLALDLNRAGMNQALLEFGRRTAGAEIALFYYAGHALNLSDENYLVPVDARIDERKGSVADIPRKTVALKATFAALARANNKIVILDASRPLPSIDELKRLSPSQSATLRAGLASPKISQSTIVLSAAPPYAVAPVGNDRKSFFAEALLSELRSPDTNIETMASRVRLKVAATTQGEQIPWVHSSLIGEVQLANRAPSGPPLTAEPRERGTKVAGRDDPSPLPSQFPDTSAAARAWEEASRSDNAARIQSFIERYPESPLAILAMRRLQELQQLERRQQEAARAAQERADMERRLSELQKSKTRSIQVEPRPDPSHERQQEAAVTPPPAAAPHQPPPPLPAPSDDQVARFPTIEAAPRVVAGATTTVLVSLTVDKVTPEVTVTAVGEGTKATPEGALSLPMPADAARMPVKVVLRAAGFDLDHATPEEATIEVVRGGDSTVARFRITARADAVGSRSLRVTLWRDNEFLANLSRKIEIVPARPVASERTAPIARAAPAAPNVRAPTPVPQFNAVMPSRQSADAQVAVRQRPRPIDLKIEILYDDNDGGLGRGRVTIATDYLGRLRHGEINTPPSIVGWLEEFYREFRSLSSRGAHSAEAPDDDTREARIGRLRAFGEELYRRAAPPVLKAALAELLDNPQVELRTVQIYSNNPVIPWELMRAPKPGGGSTDFFGIAFALARWHEDDGPRLILRPPQDQHIDEVVTVAPAYTGGQSLSSQSREIEEIQSLLATRRVSGNRSDFLTLVRDPPRGIIHFAGHGEIAGRSAVERRFAIKLEDGAFDVMDWRGVSGGQSRERALFFFNACDIGQAELVAGAVEGWAPAVLARGAAGYIGGLWPLKDDPAARFAVAFYRAVAKRLAETGQASVAGALSDARKLFYETADPTYLGYAFYGDAQLELVRR